VVGGLGVGKSVPPVIREPPWWPLLQIRAYPLNLIQMETRIVVPPSLVLKP
jgi:hypothetical protein